MDEEKVPEPAVSKRSEFAAEDVRLSLQKRKIDVGPATYTPNDKVVKGRAAKYSFGKATRFLNSKTQYLSPRHDSDQLCEAGPGPKYAPNKFYVNKTAPAYSMGPASGTVNDKDRDAAAEAAGLTSRGPSAYNPKSEFIKPVSARAVFGRASRFMDKGLYVSEQHGMRDAANSFGKPPPNHYRAKHSLTSRTPPSFSFGPSGRPGQRHMPKSDRATFMTHSVRGGMAKPATLECNVDFVTYNPNNGNQWAKKKLNGKGNVAFLSGWGGVGGEKDRTAKRFQDTKVQFIGKLHADAQPPTDVPGPQYTFRQGELSEKANSRTPRGGVLSWVP